MFRFIHSADWQLGAAFAQFGPLAERLRTQRLATLRAALDLARTRAADAFLVAGDLFEDPLVPDSLVEGTLRLFAEYPELPVCILPGNHDPAVNGPASLWNRRDFRDGALPGNVTIFREPGAHRLGPVALLVSPLRQKNSIHDPSVPLRELARQQPADRVKIGLTHGALAIPGKHQPNDFPIDPRAASRAGLDYLGIGHWHNWQTYDDGDRLVMPGTPEPDGFGQANAGHVACVEIAGPGVPPRVEKVRIGTLRWTEWECDFGAWDAHRATLGLHVSGWEDHAVNVCRVRLTGNATSEALAAAQSHLRELLGATLCFEVRNDTRPALSAGELASLEREHPILCQVFADLRQLEFFATNAAPDDPAPAAGPAISLGEAQGLLAESKMGIADLLPGDFLAARRLLCEALGAVAENVCA